jgi:hypothetical protein
VKAESKLWQKVKKNTPNIIWTRVESWASFGFPDLIAFHVKHPTDTFILAATQAPGSSKLYEYFLVPGSEIRELVACGLADREPVACASLERLLVTLRP